MSHAHRWKLDTPQPGMREVAGECACGATKAFPAFGDGAYVDMPSWKDYNHRSLGPVIEPRRWWS